MPHKTHTVELTIKKFYFCYTQKTRILGDTKYLRMLTEAQIVQPIGERRVRNKTRGHSVPEFLNEVELAPNKSATFIIALDAPDVEVLDETTFVNLSVGNLVIEIMSATLRY